MKDSILTLLALILAFFSMIFAFSNYVSNKPKETKKVEKDSCRCVLFYNQPAFFCQDSTALVFSDQKDSSIVKTVRVKGQKTSYTFEDFVGDPKVLNSKKWSQKIQNQKQIFKIRRN